MLLYHMVAHTLSKLPLSKHNRLFFEFFSPIQSRNEVQIMVISLGSISLKTEPRQEDSKDVASMHVSGVTSDEILKAIMDQAYDKFNLNIDNIQVSAQIDDTFLCPYKFDFLSFSFVDFISETIGPMARCFNSGKNYKITYFRTDLTASKG